MQRDKYLGIFFALGVLLGGLSFTFLAQVRHLPVIAQTNNTPSRTKTVIARFWHGRTLTSKADEYYAYKG
ncbi:hypothetical protein [Fischerella thermalis]|uniref:hypothetical protein n=1 Tax=Fischerella thermalis TaxID=372787 RepID=UPI002154FB48|nr:hypothetical protein [Fischerella thermalis]